jgi:hypothetical protein
MSLSWNIDDFPHKVTESVEEGTGRTVYELDPITHGLVFVTMALGWGEITEKNARDFFARLYAYERMFGSMVRTVPEDGEGLTVPRYFTPEDVREHIGLRTNVFPKMPDGKWASHMVGNLLRDGRQAFDRATKDADE